VLLWFSQDTVFGTVLAALLILAAAVARGNVTISAASSTFGVLALSGLTVFFVIVTEIVGLRNVGAFLSDYFRGSMLLQGVWNQPWGEPFRPWGIVYYLTPYLLLLITLVVLYSRIEATTAEDERARAQIVGMTCAAASLIPIAFLRSGSSNLVATSTAVPAVLVLSILHTPSMVRGPVYVRELARALLVTLLLFVYPLPASAGDIVRSQLATRGGVLEGVRRTLAVPPVPSNASLLERRLGFAPDSRGLCCTAAADLTFQELGAFVDRLHEATAGRTVYVDYTGLMYSSAIYFLADLRVGTSTPEQAMSLWLRSEVEAFRREILAHPPECAVTVLPSDGIAHDLLAVYGRYTEVTIRGRLRRANGDRLFPVYVFCRE
jgi:hypothetical protein